MILQVKELKEASIKILAAVDNGGIMDKIKDTLEIVTVGNTLQLNITNKEYYVRVKLPVTESEPFRALVDAKLFLTLVSKITTDTLELSTNQVSLIVKANGTYKLPFIYDGNSVITVPEITIDNPTMDFLISADTLNSIATINSKDLNIANAKKDFQRFYYVDEQGCFTASFGACVNQFTLPQKVVMTLSDKVVKLFKLFKDGEVKFTLGYDAYGTSMLTKVKFENDDIEITNITPTNDTILESFRKPVESIRAKISSAYDYTVTINKTDLVEALARLLLCNYAIGGFEKDFGVLKFVNDGVIIETPDSNNKELVPYVSLKLDGEYKTMIDIKQLKTTLEACNEELLTFSFGNKKGILLTRGLICNLLPEANIE